MKKNLVILISLAVFLGAAVTSCKKSFLDEKPFSSYTAATLTDSLGFEAQIVGLYNHLSTLFTYDGNQGWLCVWQVGTDVAFSTQPVGIETPYYNYASLTPTDGAASYTWSWCYRMINNCNIIITSIEDPAVNTIGQANKNATEAEARFFRGYAYNILATCFGGVPITRQPISIPRTDFTRASLDSVNNLVVSDLTYAATYLPDIESVRTNSKGKMYSRANKYQAMQLLAEAYLRTGKNDLAEQQTQAIISSGRFSLIKTRYGVKAGQAGDPFSDMFWYGNQRRNQGNGEALWVLEQENPNSVTGGNTGNAQQRRVWGAAYYQYASTTTGGMIIADSLGGRGVARLRLSNWVLYGLYPAGDMRNSRYNIRREFYYNDPGKPNYGKLVTPVAPVDTVFRLMPHTTKWYQYDPNDVFGYAMIKDLILMRLGETYLLQAEAQMKQGKLTDAAASINALRTRANAPMVTAAQMDLNFILDERTRELIGEENRRMTLMRTGTLVDRATRLNSNTVTFPLNGLTSKNLLMPIPQSEIDLNKDARLTQNPGY